MEAKKPRGKSVALVFEDGDFSNVICEFVGIFVVNPGYFLRAFAPIVSAHPYCARKFTCHVMHERAR